MKGQTRKTPSRERPGLADRGLTRVRHLSQRRSCSGIPIEILGVSADTPHRLLALEVISVHSTAINCADEKGRRWTLIASGEEFQPRSILVSSLPPLRPGEILPADAAAARRLFDPWVRGKKGASERWFPWIRGKTGALEKWFPLLAEWADFIREPELAVLGREVDKNGPLGLSGMGPGLTPAGDDYLCGWITAMQTQEARGGIDDFLRVWEPEKTTWLSRWMLLDSARGKIWKRGKDLLAALEREDAGALTSAAAKILNWGHTSGRAWLAGLAVGLSESGR